jgi:hypothetical protein
VAINLTTTLDINEVTRLIATVGKSLSVLILSEPGTGKSSILRQRAIENGDKWREPTEYFPEDAYEYVYVDAPNKRDGDLFMNMPERETQSIEQYTTSLINMNDPRPKIIMIDEALKVLKSMKPLFTRLVLERCVGDKRLPAGSEVFLTSNNVSDGVNDTIEAHFGNRICKVQMRKPTAEVWANDWATTNGISAITRTCVAMHPSVMASYLDGESAKENPYIFNPKTNPVTFVSPRSLALMDVAVRNRAVLGEAVTRAAIEGTCGLAFANLMASFIALEKELVDPRKPVAEPDKTPLPTNPSALLMLMYNMVDVVQTQGDLSNALQYVNRVESREMQAVFMTMIADNSRTAKLGSMNPKVKEWMTKNYRIAR